MNSQQSSTLTQDDYSLYASVFQSHIDNFHDNAKQTPWPAPLWVFNPAVFAVPAEQVVETTCRYLFPVVFRLIPIEALKPADQMYSSSLTLPPALDFAGVSEQALAGLYSTLNYYSTESMKSGPGDVPGRQSTDASDGGLPKKILTRNYLSPESASYLRFLNDTFFMVRGLVASIVDDSAVSRMHDLFDVSVCERHDVSVSESTLIDTDQRYLMIRGSAYDSSILMG
ncbi:uncharacterized protein V1516DRAFT_677990 [Lipomyces oligophaga]|uniref:uncharacterized protein n=1 Tax=Lipomyces oligophaga TaxID=45792 RepID=UPI0034CDBA5D